MSIDKKYSDLLAKNGKDKISPIELQASVGKCTKTEMVILMDIVSKDDAFGQPKEIEESIIEKCSVYGKIVM